MIKATMIRVMPYCLLMSVTAPLHAEEKITTTTNFNTAIPVAGPSQTDKKPNDCTPNGNHYNTNCRPHEDHSHNQIIYVTEPSNNYNSANNYSNDNNSNAQQNASYLYLIAQKKACTQPTNTAENNFSSTKSNDLNIYCVSTFRKSILQHCANIKIDSATGPLCRTAMEADLKMENK